MATVQNVASASGATGTGSSAAGGIKATQDRFLTLLVTQMKNQDPMNPLDNAQVTSQMAQLSTVTGIEKLNSSLEAMSASFMANQSLQAASLIGRSVLSPGTELNLEKSAGSAAVAVVGAADTLKVTIKDSSGAIVRTIDLGAQTSAGIVNFQWDGKSDAGAVLPDGKYTFDVTAMKGADKVATEALALSKVTSVSLGASGVSLNMANKTVVEAANVTQIF